MTWTLRPRGVAARLLTIAVLPAALMFLAVTLAMYASTVSDVRRDVAERGELVAKALAQSSPYGLVSGNLSYIRNAMAQMVTGDPSIQCISLLDDGGHELARQCQPRPRPDLATYEAPVRIETLGAMDLLDPAQRPAQPNLRTVGMVRVAMSATPIFDERHGTLALAVSLVLGVAVISCLLAWRLTRRLRLTMAAVLVALRDIRRGRFEVTLDEQAPDELGELQRTIVQMAAALGAARDELERQVRSRTQELSVAIEQIRQADAEKRRLLTHSNALIEQDRKRVAVEIHDHLGASLISVRLEASALATQAKASGHEDMARAAQRIADTVQRLYASSRNIVQSLRPEVMDTLGLAGAIEELVGTLDGVHPDCRFLVHIDPQLPDLRGELAMQAYRIVQESLTNIVKHAQATQARVRVGVNPQGTQLVMEIQDDGRGFDTATSLRTGLGLIGMRERVASMGGVICISSPQRQGTTITVTMPLNPPAGTGATPATA